MKLINNFNIRQIYYINYSNYIHFIILIIKIDEYIYKKKPLNIFKGFFTY